MLLDSELILLIIFNNAFVINAGSVASEFESGTEVKEAGAVIGPIKGEGKNVGVKPSPGFEEGEVEGEDVIVRLGTGGLGESELDPVIGLLKVTSTVCVLRSDTTFSIIFNNASEDESIVPEGPWFEDVDAATGKEGVTTEAIFEIPPLVIRFRYWFISWIIRLGDDQGTDPGELKLSTIGCKSLAVTMISNCVTKTL